jgi:hypothetical protein
MIESEMGLMEERGVKVGCRTREGLRYVEMTVWGYEDVFTTTSHLPD